MITTLLAAALSIGFFSTDLSANDRRSTIEALTSSMRERYVFPELASKVETELNRKLAAGGYDGISDGSAFADALTADLKAICKDAHLGVRYSEEALPVRAQRAQPSAEELQRFRTYARKSNAGLVKVERLEGNVGYLRIDGFMDPEIAARPIAAAMNFLSETDALIFDLRYNGGGRPDTVRLLCSYLFGPKPVHLNDLYFRESNSTSEFWTLPKLAGKRYQDRPVYVLTSKRTASGGEEFSYDLKNLHRATLVGTSTWGGANPGGMVRLGDHFGAFIPVGRAINPYTKTNWEGTGVEPDVHVDSEQALEAAHRLALEKVLTTVTDPEMKQELITIIERKKKAG